MYAISLFPDPNTVGQDAVALHFEIAKAIQELEAGDKAIKTLLTDLMGEIGTFSMDTPAGKAKFSKPAVVTRLDTDAIKQRRAEDAEFNAIMKPFDKVSEQAGSLRFTPPKEQGGGS